MFIESYQNVASKNMKYVFYKKVVLNAIKKANSGKGRRAKIKNLWDRLSVPKPLGGYASYK